MIVHELQQGSPDWLTFRVQHHGASEAAAMLGLSKTTTRTELLHVKHTGLGKEFSDYVQKNVLDYGHEVEALTRPLIAKLLGEDLYPVTCSEGKLSASCDGLTMAEDIAWENKQPNERICALVKAGQMPEEHMPQCQQVLMVTKAEKLIFSVSDGTPENLLTLEVFPDPAWFERLRAGWAQFDLDLAAYTPPAAAPVVVAEQVQALPAVLVQVSGEIVVKDNFKVFETALRDFLEHRLIREPKTDQDFADLDVQIKAMKGAEAALDGAEVQMLAQVQPVDQAKKNKDMLLKLVRDNRLMAEKLLASEKERRRTEIVLDVAKELQAHVAALNERLGKPYMPPITVDFAQVIKGMRSLSSMEDAVATRLAAAKIDANAAADKLQINLNHLRDTAADYKQLFPDTASIIQKAPDDLKALVAMRISAHKAEIEKKEQETRDRIRAEEQLKAEKDARDKLAREAEALRREEENAAATAAMQGIKEARREESLPVPVLDALEGAATHLIADLAVSRASETSKPAPNVVPMRAAPAPAAAPMTPPTMKLGDLQKHLAPLSITADGLRQLGFEPAGRERAAVLYHDAQLPHMLTAAIQQLTKAREQLVKAA